jgi:hypothetical protein
MAFLLHIKINISFPDHLRKRYAQGSIAAAPKGQDEALPSRCPPNKQQQWIFGSSDISWS